MGGDGSGDRIAVRLAPDGESAGCVYGIAGVALACDRELAALAAFRRPAAEPAAPDDFPCPGDSPAAAIPVALPGRQGWLAGAWRSLGCWSTPAGYRIDAGPGIGFAVDGRGRWICQQSGPSPNRSALALETLLGPALALALAARGIWLLHASAARYRGRVFAFAGRSGAGKSTLGQFLGAIPGWQRLADDILPVCLESGAPAGAPASAAGVAARPRFPQLKLPPGRQPGGDLPASCPLDAIFVLEGAPDRAGVSAKALTGRKAALALLRHTAAARLFDPPLLQRHLAFCAQAAGCASVGLLRYPRRPEALAEVRQALQALPLPPRPGDDCDRSP